MFPAPVSPSCCYGDYDLTLSSDQTQVEATGFLYDSDFNARSFFAMSDRESLNIAYVYGVKLSPDGSLLFQPSTNGIDIFDGRLGTLRTRIALPMPLSENYDALVSDGVDNVLIAITGAMGSGIAIVDLTSIAEPPPLTYANGDDPTEGLFVEGERNRFATLDAKSRKGSLTTEHKIPRIQIRHVLSSILTH